MAHKEIIAFVKGLTPSKVDAVAAACDVLLPLLSAASIDPRAALVVEALSIACEIRKARRK